MTENLPIAPSYMDSKTGMGEHSNDYIFLSEFKFPQRMNNQKESYGSFYIRERK